MADPADDFGFEPAPADDFGFEPASESDDFGFEPAAPAPAIDYGDELAPLDGSAVEPAFVAKESTPLSRLEALSDDEWAAKGARFAAAEDEKNARIQQTFEHLPDNPKASVLALATAFKVPTAIVKENLPAFQRSWKQATAGGFGPYADGYESGLDNAARWRRANPELAASLLKHPDKAKEIQLDVAVPTVIKALRAARDFFEDAQSAIQGALPRFDQTGNPGLPGFLDPEEGARRRALPPGGLEAERAKRDAPVPTTFLETDEARRIRESGSLWEAPWQRAKEAAIASEIATLSWRQMITPSPGESGPKDLGMGGAQGGGGSDFAVDPAVEREEKAQEAYELEKQIVDLESTSTPLNVGAGFWQDVATGGTSSAYALAEAVKLGGAGAVVGYAVGAALTKSPAGGAAGARLLGGAYGTVGLAEYTLRAEGGGTFRESAAWRDDEGKPLHINVRRGFSLLYGGTSTGIEMGEFALLAGAAKAFSVPGQVVGTGPKAALKRALLALTLRDPVFRAKLMKTGAALVGEQNEEGLQSLDNDAMAWAAKSWQQGSFSTQGIGEKSFERAADAWATAAPFSIVQTSVTVGAAKLHAALARDESVIGGKQVEALAKPKDSLLANGAAEVLAEMVADVTAKTGNPVTHVYVDAEVLGTESLFQSAKGEEGAATVEELLGPDGQRKLEDAIAAGAKVEIPMSRYVQHWGKSGLAQKLAEHTTARAGHLTAAEMKADPGRIEEQAKLIVEEAEAAAASHAQVQRQFTGIEEQLVAAQGLSAEKAKTLTAPWRAVDRTIRASFGHEVADKIFTDIQTQVVKGGALPTEAIAIVKAKEAHAQAKAAYVEASAAKAETDAAYQAALKARGLRETHVKAGGSLELAVIDESGNIVGGNEVGDAEPLRMARNVASEAYFASLDHLESAFNAEKSTIQAKGGALPTEVMLQDAVSLPALRQAYDALPLEAQQAALFTDRNTGLYNSRGFHALPAPADRTHLAEFDVEGMKFLNDKHGHESVDGALRVMAGVLQSQIPDGAQMGGTIRAWVKDAAHATAIADEMTKELGGQLRVTTAVSTGAASLDKGFEATAAEHRRIKDSEIKAGKLGHRLGAPVAFSDPAAPAIAFDDTFTGLDPKAAEAKALLAGAAKRAAGLAGKLKLSKAMGPQALTVEHVRAFEAAKDTAFDTIHREESGLLTELGFHLSQKLQPTKFVVSADLRGLRPMNDEETGFGRKGADEVLRIFSDLMAENSGTDFNAAHPHGDEFYGGGNDETSLRQFYLRFEKIAQGAVLVRKLADGRFVIQEGLHFAHGIGKSLDEADRIALPAAKEKQGDVPGPRVVTEQELEGDLRRLGSGANFRLFDVEAAVERRSRSSEGRAGSGSGGPAALNQSAVVGPVWHSAVAKSIESAKQEKNSPQAWLALIGKTPGVKAEEIEWLGLKEWLDEQKGSVTRAQVLAFVKANQIEVTESVLGGTLDGKVMYENGSTSLELGNKIQAAYEELAPPAGASTTDGEKSALLGYRAFHRGTIYPALSAFEDAAFQEPQWQKVVDLMREALAERESGPPGALGAPKFEGYKLGGEKPGTYREIVFSAPGTPADEFESSHFGKGALAHARISEHRTADGKPLFFVEEIQSDLHQQGRERGYVGSSHATEEAAARANIPDAPFKANWEEMVAKRMLRLAAEQDFDQLGWTTGEQQAERYQLSKQVNTVRFNAEIGTIEAYDFEGHVVFSKTDTKAEDLPGIIGKEAATKLLAQPSDGGGYGKHGQVLEGADLNVGGEGMKSAYDRRIPKIFERLVKKHGGKVEKRNIAGERKQTTALNVDMWRDDHSGQWRLSWFKEGNEESLRFDTEEEVVAAKEELTGDGFVEAPGPEVWTVTLPESLRKLVLTEGLPLFHGDTASPRGSIQHFRTGLASVFKIALNPTADLSTFLHESGHVFLEMFSDLAAREDAPAQVKADFAAALAWMGKTDAVVRDAATGWSFTRAQHEKWADGFLVYLREGKAPSIELRDSFKRMADWLKEIYKSVSQLGVELNPEIRAVFDRLLATDEEIASTRRAMGRPLFGSLAEAVAAGLTPGGYADWLEDLAAATSHAERAAKLEIKKELLQRKDKEWKAGLAEEVNAAEAEYDALPATQAQQILTGKGTDKYLGFNMALDRAAVEAAVGKTAARKFRLAKEGGYNPDELAVDLGFATGADMLKAIEVLPPRDVWAQKLAEHRMAEKNPGVLEDRAQLRELVGKGLHGDDSVRALSKEIAALTAKAPDGSRPVESIALAAKQMVERMPVGKLSPNRALQAERKAANAAVKELAKGNFAKVLVEKHRQLLNMYLYREMQKALEERGKFEALTKELKTPKSQARLGLASPVYRDAVDYLLEVFGLKEVGASPTQGDLTAAVDLLVADGATVAMDLTQLKDIIAKLGLNDWSSLTLAKMRVVSTALKNIQVAARNRNSVFKDEQKADLAESVALVQAEWANNRVKHPAGYKTMEPANTRAQDFAGLVNAADGSLLRPSTMLDDLGGGDINSATHQLFIAPLRKAKHLEADLADAVAQPILEASRNLPASVRASFRDDIKGEVLFPGHTDKAPLPRKRYELIMMLLNSGTASNLERLLVGRNITHAELVNALNLLTAEEIAYAQAILDSHEKPHLLPGETEAKSLKTRAFDLDERDSGVRPRELKAQSLALKNGTLRGGYFPAVYRADASKVGRQQEGDALAALNDTSYSPPATSQNHLQSRVPGFTGVLSLEPNTIQSHLQKQIHDIAFRERLKSVAKLILHPEIETALQQYLGAGKAKQFLKWLKDIGSSRGALDEAMSGLDAVTQHIRSAMPYAILGLKLSQPIGDIANLPTAIAATPLTAKFLTVGMAEFAAGGRALALEKSGEMRTQQNTFYRDFAQQVKTISSRWRNVPVVGRLSFWQDHAFFFMEGSQVLTGTPVWLGAYRQALSEGRSDSDAVKWADNILNQVSPAFSPVDQSAILRSKHFWGVSTVFYGYLNTAYQLRHIRLRPLLGKDFSDMSPSKKAISVARQSGHYMAILLAAGVLGELMMGRGPEDGDKDEDEPDDNKLKKRNWLLRKSVGAYFSGYPLPALGQAAEAAMSNMRQQSRGSIVDSYVAQFGTGMAALFDGDAEIEKRIVATGTALGMMFGQPTAPLRYQGQYLYNTLLKGADPGTAADVAESLAYGQRINGREGPITFVTNLLE